MNISDLYNLWLKPHHLPAEGQEFTIESVSVQDLTPKPNQTEKKAILKFRGEPRRLILNDGNANRLVDIAGLDPTAWAGVVVKLVPEKYNRNTDTIIIKRPGENEAGGKSKQAGNGGDFSKFWSAVFGRYPNKTEGQTVGQRLLKQAGGNADDALKLLEALV